MTKEELKFVDDKLYVYTPLSQYGAGIYEVRLVMTKEIFQECYKKWVESQEMNGKISYKVEQELNEYPGNIEIIEKQY